MCDIMWSFYKQSCITDFVYLFSLLFHMGFLLNNNMSRKTKINVSIFLGSSN